MFKPSPVLAARLRLTTKQVNGGYYKGNRTGSMGAHTEYGGYVIDYRKVRHFNCPDLTNFQLTPFVTQQMEPTDREQTRPDGTTFTPKFVDGMEYLQQWRRENLYEYDQVIEYQKQLDEKAQPETSANDSYQHEPVLRSPESTLEGSSLERRTVWRLTPVRRRAGSRASRRRTSGMRDVEDERSPPVA